MLILLRTQQTTTEPILRGRWGVQKRINEKVPKFKKRTKEQWAAIFQDILDNWET